MEYNVGKELKASGGTLTTLIAMPSILAGLLVAIYLIAQNAAFIGILLGIVICILGYVWARLLGRILVGFGILVDKLEHLNPDLFLTDEAL